MKYLLSLSLTVSLMGCISTQAHKATALPSREICVVHNPAVLHDFGAALQRQIIAKGYAARTVQGETCSLMARYTANYGWHWGVYLSRAEITLMTDGGQELGDVVYRAKYGALRKHGRVENKIAALLDQLLP